MPDEKSSESDSKTRARRPALTPEQRRFLNTPRAAPAEPPPNPPPKEIPPAPAAPNTPRKVPAPHLTKAEPPADAASSADAPVSPRPAAKPAIQAAQESRRLELQHALIFLGALLLLGVVFYAGTKLNYLRSLIASRQKPILSETVPDLFPGVPPEELVKRGLIVEKAGDWEGAVARFMAAKHKDLKYRGLLFRVGSTLYEHRAYDSADKAFERAIAFGENVEVSSFFRGLIAVRHKDYAAARQFFQNAATSARFVADYPFYAGETDRLDLKPLPAIPHYERAELLAKSEQDAAVCRFKIRMARIEATQGDAVSAELARKKAAGPLSADWLMTAAALDLRAGHPEAARAEIDAARAQKTPGLFASCVNDFYFKDAAVRYPELADALHLELDMQVPFP